MHLKYVFACLTSAAALTAGMSASEVVDGLRKISENSAVLHSSFDTIDNNTPILGLWVSFHSVANDPHVFTSFQELLQWISTGSG
jgi:hypothetical protein